MLEALKKEAARSTLFPPQIALHSVSCDGGSESPGRTLYRCAVSFTDTDITGIPHRMEGKVLLVKDGSGWSLTGM